MRLSLDSQHPKRSLLARPRLEDRLTKQPPVPVSLILGPPGSGKTSLLQRVHALMSPVVWWPEGTLFGAGSVESFLTMLSASAADQVRLVVDDLHRRPPAMITDLTRYRPDNVVLILAGRSAPTLDVASLVLTGDIDYIGGEDLRFRSWEVEDLFSQIHRRPIASDVGNALARRLDGWAAGLGLIAQQLAHQDPSDLHGLLEIASSPTRQVRAYLDRHVADELHDQLWQFMIRTAPLGVLTGPLCDEFLGATGGLRQLWALEEAQLLRPGPRPSSWRYPHALRNYLIEILSSRLSRDELRGHHRRGAQLLEQYGFAAEAMLLYLRADAQSDAQRLLRQNPDPGDRSWVPDLLSSSASLPPETVRGLMLLQAHHLARAGSVQSALAAFDQVINTCDDPAVRADALVSRMALSVWLPNSAPGQQSNGHHQGGSDEQLRSLTRVVVDDRSGSSAVVRVLATTLAGSFQLAADLLDREAMIPSSDAIPTGEQLTLRMIAFVVHAGAGHVGKSREIELIIDACEAADLRWLARIARAIRRALVITELEPVEAHRRCRLMVWECERDNDLWGELLIGLVHGVAMDSIGQREWAHEFFQRSADLAVELDAPVLRAWAHSLDQLYSSISSKGWSPSPAGLEADRSRLGISIRELHETWRTRRGDNEADGTSALLDTPSADDPRRGGLALLCFGHFELRGPSGPLDFARLRPRARELLMLLAINHGHRMHRERLIDLLWPGLHIASGIRSLQVAVSTVRASLQPLGQSSALRRIGDSYVLELDGVWDQLASFEQLVRRADQIPVSTLSTVALARRIEALDHYTGDLLPEVGPAEWVVHDRDRLRALAARLAAEAADLALATEEYATGLHAARRSLSIDAYQDRAWLSLIELQERSGDPTAARRSRLAHARVSAEMAADPLTLVARPRPSADRRTRPRGRRGPG